MAVHSHPLARHRHRGARVEPLRAHRGRAAVRDGGDAAALAQAAAAHTRPARGGGGGGNGRRRPFLHKRPVRACVRRRPMRGQGGLARGQLDVKLRPPRRAAPLPLEPPKPHVRLWRTHPVLPRWLDRSTLFPRVSFALGSAPPPNAAVAGAAPNRGRPARHTCESLRVLVPGSLVRGWTCEPAKAPRPLWRAA